jgi:hypothetical protein
MGALRPSGAMIRHQETTISADADFSSIDFQADPNWWLAAQSIRDRNAIQGR